jgi:4-diphosphocytidyl-2C-methyl-D-erythritol kinase
MAEPGVARRTSEHFASEFGSGLTVSKLVERAAVLAAANDLLPAAAAVVAGLVPLRRALARLLGRPIGLTGSGPTLWCLYPSRKEADAAAATVEQALDTGTLTAPGEDRPFVAAATIRAGARPSTHLERSDE